MELIERLAMTEPSIAVATDSSAANGKMADCSEMRIDEASSNAAEMQTKVAQKVATGNGSI